MLRSRLQINRDAAFGFVIAAALFWMGAGCADSGKAPGTAVPIKPKGTQQIATKSTATLIEAAQLNEYSYAVLGRRDPFSPLIVRQEEKAKGGDRTPLERYNIFDFKLTGIVWGGYGYNAMLEAPDGKGYFIKIGTVIGFNKGVVKKITSRKLVIEEKFKNFSGETERKEITIELQKKQEALQ
jgi:type IV pilus assembly protein PilP